MGFQSCYHVLKCPTSLILPEATSLATYVGTSGLMSWSGASDLANSISRCTETSGFDNYSKN